MALAIINCRLSFTLRIQNLSLSTPIFLVISIIFATLANISHQRFMRKNVDSTHECDGMKLSKKCELLLSVFCMTLFHTSCYSLMKYKYHNNKYQANHWSNIYTCFSFNKYSSPLFHSLISHRLQLSITLLLFLSLTAFPNTKFVMTENFGKSFPSLFSPSDRIVTLTLKVQ